MKTLRVLAIGSTLAGLLIFAAPADSGDEFADTILDVYPGADVNNDGQLSLAEQAAVETFIVERFPKADRDGDGQLSAAEKKRILQTVNKAEAQKALSDFSPRTGTQPVTSERSAEESPVREGPRPIKPGDHGVGRQIPDLSFTDITGRQHSLSDYANQKAVVMVMTGTGCPLCLKYAPSLAEVEQRYSNRGVSFIFVNPNESERGAELEEAVNTHGFKGPYISDGDRVLPSALAATTTTEVFVLDSARTLIYRGAVDDQYGFAYSLPAPRNSYLTEALDAALQNRTPLVQATTSPGCELFYDSPLPEQPDNVVTYHNQVSRIIQANCIECHRDGGIAPIALETYEQVKDYAGMIRNVVDRGIMPPWFAAPQATDTSTGEIETLHWANDRSLSERDKETLFAWLKAGAPAGDSASAPLQKTFPDGWLIGKPDQIFQFDRPVKVKATGTMPYQHITVETDLPEDKWVQAIEVRPGQLEVVHHVIVSLRGDGEVDERDGYWAAYVPGNSTFVYPDGYARRLPRGAKLRFQMHYTPNGTATEDVTQIGLIFADKPPKHEIKVRGIANSRIRIPPRTAMHPEVAELHLPYDIEVLGFLPHMHLRGQAARYELVSSGKSEVLLDVPRYDFNWQLMYNLAEPRTLRKGDTIRFTGWFDNSADNPANPDPNRTVRWGQQTEDEMHLGYVEYVVPGVTPGESAGGLNRSPSRTQRSDQPADSSDTIRIGRRTVQISGILTAIKRLDRDGDGELERTAVPSEYQQLFDRLDADNDGILTTEEAEETLRRYQKQTSSRG